MVKDPFYHAVIKLVQGMFKAQDLRFHVTGGEHVPASGGAVIVANHTGYLDFTYVGVPFYEKKRLVRFMAKAEVWKNPIGGPVMRGMKHIPVDRIDTEASYNQAVADLKAGELVGIFPEGTVSRSLEIKKLRTGAVRMALEAGVPIIPVLLIGSQRVWPKWGKKNLGRSHTPIEISVLPAWTPDPADDINDSTAKLRSIMSDGLTALWERYDERHGPLPKGAPWIPARFGGSAPTLEEAQKLDDEIVAERRRVRKLRDDLDALAEKVSAAIAAAGTHSKELVVQGASATAPARQALSQLADDATTGVKEGANKVAAAGEKLKALAAQIPASMPEDAVTALVSEAKQIRDRLPYRVKARLPQLPAAVITDVDGTIWDNGLSDATIEVLDKLHEAGVPHFLATGRAPHELRPVQQQLPHQVPAVCANGAVVLDANNEVLHVVEIANLQAIRDGIDAARTVFPELEVEDDVVDGKVVKITVRAKASSAEIRDVLSERGVDATYSNPYGFVEISPTTKADGVRWLLEHEGIDPQDVVAFGDMPNDKEMLEFVGTGVAMGNADAVLINNAKWVTLPVSKDGVAEFLRPVL